MQQEKTFSILVMDKGLSFHFISFGSYAIIIMLWAHHPSATCTFISSVYDVVKLLKRGRFQDFRIWEHILQTKFKWKRFSPIMHAERSFIPSPSSILLPPHQSQVDVLHLEFNLQRGGQGG